jgi:hypothetical protein
VFPNAANFVSIVCGIRVGAGEARMIAIRRIHGIIRSWEGPGNLMLVSHGRTVAAVVYGRNVRSPEQAEPIVLEPSDDNRTGFREIGTIPPPGVSRT